MKLQILFALTFVMVGWGSFAQQVPTLDPGNVKDGVYSNSYFGFSYAYPKNWVVHGEATQGRIKEIAKEQSKKTGALSEAATEVVMKNTYQLLTVFQHALGTPNVRLNPLIQVIAEDVRHAPAITDGRTYLLYVRPMMMKMGGKPVQSEPVELQVSGRQFFRQDYQLELNGVSYQYAVVLTISKGYALAFSFSAEDQKGVDDLAKTLETLIFSSSPHSRT
jgi:hypothetical protein